jgi:protein-L-isoaspartate(D-aspartate) O-methyltransferase
MDTVTRIKRFPADYERDNDSHGKSIRDTGLNSRRSKQAQPPPQRTTARNSQLVATAMPASPSAISTQPSITHMPSGVGLDSSAIRMRMVQRLRAAQAAPEPILAALQAVPRHEFVDAGLVAQAYEDTALPIGHGQTISKPSSVARLLAAANLHRHAPKQARVLDIGTGCGYQAAVLAQLCREVVSIERFKDLHEKARTNLRKVGVLGIHGVRLVHGDAAAINTSYGLFDAIVSAASAASVEQVPPVWIERLAVGGVLVAPVGQAEQQLLRVVKLSDAPGDVQATLLEAVKFVPLQSGKR